MDNKQYITQLSRRATLNYKETQKLVTSVIETIIEVIDRDEILAIPAFGTFQAEKQEEYVGVDENTGRRMLYPPVLVPRFTPGNILIKNVAENK